MNAGCPPADSGIGVVNGRAIQDCGTVRPLKSSLRSGHIAFLTVNVEFDLDGKKHLPV